MGQKNDRLGMKRSFWFAFDQIIYSIVFSSVNSV